MKTHRLKTWPEFFQAVWDWKKPFEVRKDDRDFGVDDRLVLKEWDPSTETYTGRKIMTMISYILRGEEFGIKDGYCVLGLTYFYLDKG